MSMTDRQTHRIAVTYSIPRFMLNSQFAVNYFFHRVSHGRNRNTANKYVHKIFFIKNVKQITYTPQPSTSVLVESSCVSHCDLSHNQELYDCKLLLSKFRRLSLFVSFSTGIKLNSYFELVRLLAVRHNIVRISGHLPPRPRSLKIKLDR